MVFAYQRCWPLGRSRLQPLILNVLSIIGWFSFSIGSFLSDQLWMFKYAINLFSKVHIQYNTPIPNESILLPVFFPIASILITFGIMLTIFIFPDVKAEAII